MYPAGAPAPINARSSQLEKTNSSCIAGDGPGLVILACVKVVDVYGSVFAARTLQIVFMKK